MLIVYSPKCLEYFPLATLEMPGRVKNCAELLKTRGVEFIEPQQASLEDILAVHTLRLVNEVKKEADDDVTLPGEMSMFDYAALSAGSAITAARLALEKNIKTLSLMRPPGHHAGRDFNGGFCYFNNMAIAVKKYLSQVGKIAILDLDCHHGNGTQDIFLGQQNVLYVSLHQNLLFPGTGASSQLNCLNFPLKTNTGEAVYLPTLDLAIRKIYDWQPKLLGVSFGFDTYKEEFLADLKLETASYKKIGERIAALHLPTFCILEGGYNTFAMPECLLNFLEGMGS